MRQAQAVAACPGFFRRDRSGQALFVSDFPKRVALGEGAQALSRLRASGWQVAVDHRQLAFLMPELDILSAFLRSQSGDTPAPFALGLYRILQRASSSDEVFDPALFRQALLLWDACDHARLLRLLGQTLAVCQRRRQPFPALLLPLVTKQTHKETQA